MVPSSSTDVTHALSGFFRGGSVSVSFAFVLFQNEAKPPGLSSAVGMSSLMF